MAWALLAFLMGIFSGLILVSLLSFAAVGIVLIWVAWTGLGCQMDYLDERGQE